MEKNNNQMRRNISRKTLHVSTEIMPVNRMQIAIVLRAVTLIIKGVSEIINRPIAIIDIKTKERWGNLYDLIISSSHSYMGYTYREVKDSIMTLVYGTHDSNNLTRIS